MKILILDDIQSRLDTYRRVYEGHEVTTVMRFHEFVDLLHSQKWDLVHLDHDLGDYVENADTYTDGWGKTREYNGCHAADAVCALDEDKRPSEVIIHSINGAGSATMLRTLQRMGISATRQPYTEPCWSKVEED